LRRTQYPTSPCPDPMNSGSLRCDGANFVTQTALGTPKQPSGYHADYATEPGTDKPGNPSSRRTAHRSSSRICRVIRMPRCRVGSHCWSVSRRKPKTNLKGSDASEAAAGAPPAPLTAREGPWIASCRYCPGTTFRRSTCHGFHGSPCHGGP
jgi:hypothetical protein